MCPLTLDFLPKAIATIFCHCSEQPRHRERIENLDVPHLRMDLRRGRRGSGARPRCRHRLGRRPDVALLSDFSSQDYYPATLHVLSLMAIAERYPTCLTDFP